MAQRFLICGLLAGPLFIAVALVQAVTRDGYDLGRHPISLLSLGEGGWVQVANFIVAGGLCLACAVGLRRSLRSGPGHEWGPRLIGLMGAGLVLAGVFVTSAGAGFPPGAPAGAPEFSWNDGLHTLGFMLATIGAVAGGLVFARRFAAARQWGWFTATTGAAAAIVVLVGWPDTDGVSVRLLVAAAVTFATVALAAASALVTCGAWSLPKRPASSPVRPGS